MMIITTREQFEAALERVLGYLARPPAPGTPEDSDFTVLLSSLESYRGKVDRSEAHNEVVSSAFSRLDREFANFRHRYATRSQAGIFGGFGFGRDLSGRT
jgi:hypothetical protein